MVRIFGRRRRQVGGSPCTGFPGRPPAVNRLFPFVRPPSHAQDRITQDRSRTFSRSSADRPGRPRTHPTRPFPGCLERVRETPGDPLRPSRRRYRRTGGTNGPAHDGPRRTPLPGRRRLPTDHDGTDVAARAFGACYPDGPSPQ